MKKRIYSGILSLAMIASLAGCSSQTTTDSSSSEDEAGIYTPGTYTATATGMGELSATVTVDANSITSVELDLSNETESIGQQAGDTLIESILEAQGTEIDNVSGATVTSEAVKTAVNAALAEARGEEETEASVKMEPGTYNAEAFGFFMGFSNKVSVTVDETSIVSIEWNPDEISGDTEVMRKAVAENMFPRIIENQSVAVDGVTGATGTSSSVKLAVTDALKQALVAGGSDESAISAFQVAPEKTNDTQEITTDVLVVGLGGSGVYTSLRAAEQGLDVLAIEKQGRYGGTTALTSEIGVVNPERIQDLYNDGEDYIDADAFRTAWLEYTGGDEKEEFVDLYIEQSGDALDWLAVDHDIEFDWEAKTGFTAADVYAIKFQWLPNANPDDPEDTRFWNVNKTEIGENFDKLMEDFTEAGGEYMLETTATELIYEDGAVVGVKATDNLTGTEYTIHAKAVVIAEGGFLGSSEMTTEYLSDEYYPLKGAWSVYGSKGNTGDMMKSAIENGAATYNIGMPPEVHLSGSVDFIPQSAGFPVNIDETTISNAMGTPMIWSVADAPMYLGISSNSMAIGMDGKRFTSEEGISMLDPWIAGPNYYSIWSTEQLNDVMENGFTQDFSTVPPSAFLGYCASIPTDTPLPELYDVLDYAEEMGFVWKADTIEELAELIGVDAETLANEVETYNSYVENGVDEDFGKAAENLVAVGEGPYYAIKMASYSYNTVAGLDIDVNLQVLDTDGNPVEGLFAVGSDSAGVLFSESKPYVTFGGINNGWALTSGYICGTTIADYINGTDNAAEILNSEVIAEYGGFEQ